MHNKGQDWFYYSPKTKIKTAKVDAPPASQIPGLSMLVPDPSFDDEERRRRAYIRDSDSKYIRLAKQGGRKNLLQFHEKGKSPSEAQSYPRVDWFEHHAMTSQEEQDILARSAWKPPEYMLQNKKQQSMDDVINDDIVDIDISWARTEGKNNKEKYNQRDAPYHTNYPQLNKDNKIETENKQQQLITINKTNKWKKPRETTTTNPSATNTQPTTTNFEKLISGGYGDEWRNQRELIHHKQLQKWSQLNKAHNNQPPHQAPIMSEYQHQISKKQNPRKLKPLPNHQQQQQTPPLRHSGDVTDKNKSNWKLSKFEKVKAKINTTRT